MTTINITTGIITAITLVAALVLGILRVDTFLTNKSVTECMKASVISVKNTDGSTWSGPNNEWNKFCLTQNGIEIK